MALRRTFRRCELSWIAVETHKVLTRARQQGAPTEAKALWEARTAAAYRFANTPAITHEEIPA